MRSWGLLLLSLLVSGSVAADQIRLKDGTEFSATLTRKDGEHVTVVLPRSDVETVNGNPLPAPVTAGTVAPAFEAVDLAGNKHALTDYRGSPTLLQFWATWCPHCRADLGLMIDLFRRYDDKGLKILTVSIDQDLDKLGAFVSQYYVPYPVIPVSDPTASIQQALLPELYEAEGVPAYYLINKSGTIAKAISGSVTEGGVDLEGELKRLLTSDLQQESKGVR